MTQKTNIHPHWLSRATINELAKLGVLKNPYIAAVGTLLNREFLPSFVLDNTTIFIRKRNDEAVKFKRLEGAKNCIKALGFAESDIEIGEA